MAIPTRIIFTSAVLLIALASAQAGPIDTVASHQIQLTQAQDPRREFIQIDVRNDEGRSVPGVDVIVSLDDASQPDRPKLPRLHGATDQEGRARIDLAVPISLKQSRTQVTIWAHAAGRGMTMASAPLRVILFSENSDNAPFHLVLAQPVKQTITVLDADDHPIQGLRLAPRLILNGKADMFGTVPDEWIDHWIVTTNAQGEATFQDLSPKIKIMTVQVAGPGITTHTLPLVDNAAKPTLKLGRPGRLVGIVRSDSAQPIKGASVEIWARATGTSSRFAVNQASVPTMKLPLDTQSMTTGPQGAFQTPPALVAGSTYRVVIRHPGFAPFVSEWQPMSNARIVVPPIRLKSLRTLTGQILDRQNQPIPGARVFLTAGGPSTTTRPDGRFTLSNVLPEKTIILVQHPSFRLQGWPIDPATQTTDLTLKPARSTESPDLKLTALPEPIPEAESHALALRAFAPYLQQVLEQGTPEQKERALATLADIDPLRILELFNEGVLEESPLSDELRFDVAMKLVISDPAKAESVIMTISSPSLRIAALCYAIPAISPSQAPSKRHMIETTISTVRAVPASPVKAAQLGTLADLWLDFNELDRARALIQEAKQVFDALPEKDRQGAAAKRIGLVLAQLQQERGLGQKPKPPAFDRLGLFARLEQGALVMQQPMLLERLWKARQQSDQIWIDGPQSSFYRLAVATPARARTMAASIEDPVERVSAWAYVALGLAKKDQAAARETLDHAIQSLDHLPTPQAMSRDNASAAHDHTIHLTNPAAFILPIVERIAPDRLEEVFWRAVALHPHVDAQNENLLHGSAIGDECTLLARYDRSVAAILFQPIDKHLQSLITSNSEISGFHASSLIAKSCLDPQAAVALVEALPQPRQLSPWKPISIARVNLAITLGQPAKTRWQWRWQQLGAPMPFAD